MITGCTTLPEPSRCHGVVLSIAMATSANEPTSESRLSPAARTILKRSIRRMVRADQDWFRSGGGVDEDNLDAFVTALVALLEGETDEVRRLPLHFGQFTEFLSEGSVHVRHLVRLIQCCVGPSGRERTLEDGVVGVAAHRYFAGALSDYLFYQDRPDDVEAVRSALAEVGAERDLIAKVAPFYWSAECVAQVLEPFDEEVVEALAVQVRLVDDGLARDRNEVIQSKTRIYRVLACRDALPPRFVPFLWKEAFQASSEAVREAAQDALRGQPDALERVASMLEHKKKDVRAIAASCLARFGADGFVPKLEARLDEETEPQVRIALLDAIEQLGASTERFLSADAADAEAQRCLANVKPSVLENLAWFPFDRLPPVRWHASEDPVHPDTLRWWIVSAVMEKESRPGALLKRYLGALEARDREELAHFMIDAWIHKDVGNAPEPDGVVNRGPSTSASAFRGLLAFTSEGGADRSIRAIEQYIHAWRSYRPPQCKVLAGVLGQIGSPTAVQLLTKLATSDSAKALRESAQEALREVASREGWSVDELSDRMVPELGFGADGTNPLDLGARTLTMRVQPEGVELLDPRGEPLKKFPSRAESDDADAYARAKRTFSATKKDTDQILTLQRRRLYEAMCAGRDWTLVAWKAHLEAHPIVGCLVKRVLWRITTSGEHQVIRLGPDGAFLDLHGVQVEPASTAKLAIAHGSHIDGRTRAAWRKTLTSTEAPMLFEQLSEEALYPTDLSPQSLSITTFEGCRANAWTLDKAASNAGFVRGERLDRGYVHWYEKTFSSLELRVYLDFSGFQFDRDSGSTSPDVDLYTIRFHRLGEGDTETPLFARDVPPIAVMECMKPWRIAAQSGPDGSTT